MNKYADISKINEWTNEEVKEALEFYTNDLHNNKSNDIQEMRWLKRAISKCESILNKPSEWENLFN